MSLSSSKIHNTLECYLTENWDTKFLKNSWKTDWGIKIPKTIFIERRRFRSLTIIAIELLIYAGHFSASFTYISQFYNLQNVSFNPLGGKIHGIVISPFFRWTKLKSYASGLRFHSSNCEKQNSPKSVWQQNLRFYSTFVHYWMFNYLLIMVIQRNRINRKYRYKQR